jgi:hypothetical protein
MLETKKPFAAGFALALLTATGCYDFETAFKDCVTAGQCQPARCERPLPDVVDLPDDRFIDTNCDEVDGMRDNAIFVDPAGQDSHPGTREEPLKHLAAALERAATQGKAIYLAQGTYDEENLRMDKAVSIYGGYSGIEGNWKRGPEYITRIGGGTPTGFTVSGLADAGVVLERVHIRSATSTVPGTPSIGLRVVDSSGVRLRHVQVEAGAGAPGRNGDSPGPTLKGGADGGVGQNGDAPAGPTGGPPGTSSCGTGSYGGGQGGQGSVSDPLATAGTPGAPSTPGGGAGVNKLAECNSSGTYCECLGDPGGNGEPGPVGDTGKHGLPGDGTGALEGGTWVAKSGTNGEAGAFGKGGGGGGGGGYCQAPPLSTSKGGGGGGGGAGGCPGTGAQGGQGGGASIAMLLIRGHVELESCTLKTGGGGQGGAGGRGGDGGPGGPGGDGGEGILEHKTGMDTSGRTLTYRATGGKGGKGGKGGDGGPGGHGGNGGGGPSVGVWCDGPETSSVTQTGTTFGLKDPGARGPGPLPEGNRGLLTNYHGCPGSP